MTETGTIDSKRRNSWKHLKHFLTKFKSFIYFFVEQIYKQPGSLTNHLLNTNLNLSKRGLRKKFLKISLSSVRSSKCTKITGIKITEVAKSIKFSTISLFTESLLTICKVQVKFSSLLIADIMLHNVNNMSTDQFQSAQRMIMLEIWPFQISVLDKLMSWHCKCHHSPCYWNRMTLYIRGVWPFCSHMYLLLLK